MTTGRRVGFTRVELKGVLPSGETAYKDAGSCFGGTGETGRVGPG
jgi:hypothetical protein